MRRPGTPTVRGHVRTEGAHIHFETFGSGRPLVLLHGNGEELHVLDEQIVDFAEHHRVIAIDTRGHGRSGAGSAPWDFSLFSRDVLAVLDELTITRAHVFGFSDGGNIALQLAADTPLRLSSIIAVGANLDPTGLESWDRGMMAARQRVLRAAAGRKRPRRLAERSRVALRRLDLMLEHPHIDPVRLRQSKVPALIIAGQRDVVRRAHTELIAASLPGSRLEIVPGADHFVPVKNPRECNRLVLEFLSGL